MRPPLIYELQYSQDTKPDHYHQIIAAIILNALRKKCTSTIFYWTIALNIHFIVVACWFIETFFASKQEFLLEQLVVGTFGRVILLTNVIGFNILHRDRIYVSL